MAVFHNPSFPQVEGYRLTAQLYCARRTAVYRGISDTQPQKKVVIKLLCSEHPSFSELVKFRNQYVVASNLSIDGVVKPLELRPWRNGYALVMEDFGGVALGEYGRERRLTWREVLAIALQIADILHALHQASVIHKDIKPANLLIHPETKQIQLIDFSIASLLPKETQELQSPNALEGTLAYMAPEQTGRMNRGIDYRADFYALGVTLYELLTGQLPFPSGDPMELVHCHIAKIPAGVDEINGQVPAALSAIVAKLMAKNVEARYQSALGLKHDLQQCGRQWEESGRIEPFELGQRDLSDRFLIPEKLYGREAEVQTLLDAFERVSQGVSEMMLVAGYSGVGKTAVINEIHKPITRQKGYFIKGKFDQLNRNIPFSAFVQAFRSLMEQLLSESDIALASWKTKILAAVGESGQVLIEVIPELEHIIGQQPDVPELSGNAAQNRFNLLFGKFIRVFATSEHPLVIFLDDLQWVDPASLHLFQLLMDDESGYLLVLGAYRNNEVFPAHSLMLTLDDICKQGATLNTLTLTPLQQNDINHLVAESLHCSRELALPLSQLVYQKTQGNPFFATQFLQGLAGDGWITFKADAGYWQCDLTQVRQLALTDDVLAFMIGRIQKLPDATQSLLKISACMGNQFDLSILAIVCEKSQEELAASLWRALQVGLVIPKTEAYKFFQGTRQDSRKSNENIVEYRFLHDRVQQAAYSLISEKQRQSNHYRIGKLLLQYAFQEKKEEFIFDIANHLNQGTALCLSQKERKRLAELNLTAGKKALMSTAYESAAQYLEAGAILLDQDSWEKEYELTLSIFETRIKAEYLNINFSQAHALADLVAEKITSVLDRVKLYELKIQMYMAQAKTQKALHLGSLALETLGVDLEDAPDAAEVQLPQLSAVESLPAMQDIRQIAIMRILIALLSPAYIIRPDLLPPMLLTMINLSLQQGHISFSAQAYVWYGLFLCTSQRDLEKGYDCGLLALKVLERFPSDVLECSVSNLFNVFIRPWKEPLTNSMKPLAKAREAGFRTGDFEFASYATAHRCTYLFLAGENLAEVQKQQKIAMDILHRVKQNHSLGHAIIWQRLVFSLLDEEIESPNRSPSYADENNIFSDFYEDEDRSLSFTAYLAECVLQYFSENYSAAVTAAVNAEANINVSIGITAITYSFYFSLSVLSLQPINDNESLLSLEEKLLFPVRQNINLLLEKLAAHRKSIREWASVNPGYVEHKHQLLEAEYHRVLGQRAEAMELYEQAIAGAKENEYLQEEALANELAAKFYLSWGKERVAADYIQDAYSCYARWGAKAKTDDLEQRYPRLLESVRLQRSQSSTTLDSLNRVAPFKLSSHSSLSTSSSNHEINEALDLGVLLKSTQALTESIDLKELLRRISQLILQVSGADKLVLLLPEAGDSWQVRVSATPDDIQLTEMPFVNCTDLPIQFIQYVKRSQEILVVDDLETQLPIIDTYLQQYKPSSILCLPILRQKNLTGLLYLQNQSNAGVFDLDRITLLNFLCAQAAIALDNARLYQLEQTKTRQLAASEKRLKALFDQESDAVFLLGNQGFIDCNRAAVKLFSYPNKDELLALRPEQLSPEYQPDGQMSGPKIQGMLQEALQRPNLRFEWLCQRFHGEYFWAEITLTTVRYQEETIFHCVVRDVSAHKQLEREQDRLTQILQSTSDFVSICQPEKGILWQNQPFRELRPDLNITEEDIPIAKLYPEWAFEIIQQEGLPTAIQDGIWSGETALLTPSGEEIPTSQVIIAHTSKTGEIEYFSTILRDISDRKQAEEQLKALSQRLELALESAGLGIWECNFQNHRLSWDDRMFEIYGISPEAFGGTYQDWERTVHPDDLEQATRGNGDKNPTSNKEFRIIRPDGSIRYVVSTFLTQLDEYGQLIRAVGTNLDVTDRKTAELAFKESQDQLRRITENIPGMIFRCVMDPDGNDRITDISAKVREIYELEPEAVIADGGRQMWARCHPDDLDRITADIQTSAETLQPLKNEQRLILPEKGLRWIQSIAQPERLDNGYMAWDGVVIDITDRKLAEQQLRELSERLELAIDSAQLGIWEWDYKKELLSWDERMFAIFGVRPEDFQGTFQDWERCVHPDDIAYAKEDACSSEQLTQRNNQATKEYRIIHPDGTIRYVLATAVIQWDKQGRLDRAIGMNLDITDQKVAEEKLKLTNEKLIKATRLKDEFLANMSHELRTPLNSVIGFSQLMQRDSSLTDKHKETLNTINRSGEHLLSLINDILEMSKIEAGQTTLNLEPVNLPQLLDDLKNMLSIKADAKRLAFDFSYAADIPHYIQADEVKLKQILLNLLSNALKFTTQGQVTFYAEALTCMQEESKEKVCLRFSVIDTGPGISEESQKVIFQPFIQASAGQHSYQGTGLGLPISQKFAAMMGGDVAVSSIEGQGSTFHCEICVDALADDRAAEPSSHQRYQNIQGLKDPKASYRLLVVDDNADNCQLLSQMLSLPGFELATASNGLEAVEWNERWQPHLIWMDIRMPVMDGLEAVRHIRQSARHQPKIIAITANAFVEEREVALEVGCDDFISKPLTENKIFEQLDKLLDLEFISTVDGVEKGFGSDDVSTSNSPSKSDEEQVKEGLRAMPEDWQLAFQKAICSLDNEAVMSLLIEVPEEHQAMVNIIVNLQENYRYDILVEMVKPVS